MKGFIYCNFFRAERSHQSFRAGCLLDFSLQFLCVLCVLLLLQAVVLTMALIFEKKVNLPLVFHTSLSTPNNGCPQPQSGWPPSPLCAPPDICALPEQHTRGNQALLRWPGLQKHLGLRSAEGKMDINTGCVSCCSCSFRNCRVSIFSCIVRQRDSAQHIRTSSGFLRFLMCLHFWRNVSSSRSSCDAEAGITRLSKCQAKCRLHLIKPVVAYPSILFMLLLYCTAEVRLLSNSLA